MYKQIYKQIKIKWKRNNIFQFWGNRTKIAKTVDKQSYLQLNRDDIKTDWIRIQIKIMS